MTWLSNDVVTRLRDVATWPELPLDRYVLLRSIGRGGMGTVYAARDERLGREVAIKVSNAPVPGSGLDRRLQHEARVLAELEHPGIVPVHDAGLLADGRVFYVMKLVRGETLNTHMASLTDEAARLAVFERVTETVAFAHAAGIVHRDLKPSNVMLGPFGEVLVLDWGIAKRGTEVFSTDSGRSVPEVQATSGTKPRESVENTSVPLGTPGFMAPEQARGGAAVGPAADVYALGALLQWMTAAGTPPPARRLRAIIDKCLAPEPADRYPTAAVLADDIARYRAGAGVSAYRETLVDRAGRWFGTYRTFILLVLAYLIMRTLLAFMQR